MDYKQILGDLYTPELETKLKETKWIPKSRLDEVISQKSELENQLKVKDDQIKQNEVDLQTLKESAKDLPELNEKIAKMQEESENIRLESEKRLIETTRNFELHKKLINDGVEDEKARNLLISELNDVSLKDGNLVGYDDLVKPLRESNTFGNWFSKDVIKGNEHQMGEVPEPQTKLQELQTQLREAQESGNTIKSVTLIRQINELEV